MSGGHDHNHNHHHFQSSQARLRVAFWTQAAFFVVELVGGILSNSLALLADAGHMLSDVAALGLSLLALRWALRSPTNQKTFGYHRLEILVALINGLVLWKMHNRSACPHGQLQNGQVLPAPAVGQGAQVL